MFDKKLNDDKLNALPLLDYLKWIRDHTEHLTLDISFWEAKEIIQNLKNRFDKEAAAISAIPYSNEIIDLTNSTEIELSDYHKYANTKSAKSEVVATFKSDIEEITRRLIHEIENK